MRVSNIFLLSVLPFTLAQYGYGNGGGTTSSTTAAAAPATTTSSGGSTVHTVTAGSGGSLAYSPNDITAAVGDTIEFHFFAPEHSVAQSNFANPCVPSGPSAFFSGIISESSGQNANVFTVTVNDTNPIWFYCVVPTHCQAGMAGVINAPSNGDTLAAYVSNAAKATTGTPVTVQGGVLGPPMQAAAQGSTTSSAASSSATAKSAGVESRGSANWVILAITGVVAAGVGSLIV